MSTQGYSREPLDLPVTKKRMQLACKGLASNFPDSSSSGGSQENEEKDSCPHPPADAELLGGLYWRWGSIAAPEFHVGQKKKKIAFFHIALTQESETSSNVL